MSSTFKTEGSEHRYEHKQDANTVTAGSLISFSSNYKLKVKLPLGSHFAFCFVSTPFFKASTV